MTKESIGGRAGERLRLRPWQRALLDALLTEARDGRLLYRTGLIGIARKNGKSAWSASLGLFGLFFGDQGYEVYSCAGDRDQARIVFNTAKAMVEMDPELRERCRVMRDAIVVNETQAIYRVLSSDAPRQEGLSPNLVIFDEVHVQPNDELWNVMELASGARHEPLMLGITTAGVRTDTRGEESLCYRLYQHGIDVAKGIAHDPTFFFAWWEPVLGAEADHRDPRTWAEANPGLGDIVSEADFYSTLARTPEPEFRTKRTNVFVTSQQAWLPYGAWDACEVQGRQLREGERVVLGFDGSYNNDSTALVACRVGRKPYVQTLRIWERPQDVPDWTVPIEEVENAIRAACAYYRVQEIECDPARWARSLQKLASEGLPIVEFPQTPERMVPATQRFYEAVMNKTVAHGNDPVLAKHLGNCVLKVTERGSRIVKVTKSAPAKIDAAVATVMAFFRAAGPATPAAGFLAAWRRELNPEEILDVDDPTPHATAAPPKKWTPKDYLLGPGAKMPTPALQCQHRWSPFPPQNCLRCTIPRAKWLEYLKEREEQHVAETKSKPTPQSPSEVTPYARGY